MLLAQDAMTRRFWRRLGGNTFFFVGLFGTLLKTYALFLPTSTWFEGGVGLSVLLGLSAAGGLWRAWPQPIAEEFDSPKTKIKIVRGDLLAQDGHLVIGTNDTFDTETPSIIEKSSLQGQTLERLYGGDRHELNLRLDEALVGKASEPGAQKPGKTDRFGIGTTAVLKQQGRLLFFLAYSELDLNNKASSSPDKMWKSLLSLWECVRSNANGRTVAIPVFGGGLTRLSHILPAQDSIRFTVLSFMMASRHEPVCDELRVVVQPKEYEKLDRLELQAFLSSLRPS